MVEEARLAFGNATGLVLHNHRLASYDDLTTLKQMVNSFDASLFDDSVEAVLKSRRQLRPFLCRLPRHSSPWRKFVS